MGYRLKIEKQDSSAQEVHLEELLDESMGFGVMEDLRLHPFEMGS